MKTSNPVSNEELEAAFRDDPEFGIEFLYAEYRQHLGRYIKSKLWGLPEGVLADELNEVFQNTMAALIPKIRDPDFDWKDPLRLVYTIARNKAADARRKYGHQPKQDAEGALDLLARDLAGTNIASHWNMKTKTDWREFHAALLQVIASSLTAKEAIVARCFVDHYEDFGERDMYAPLARVVGQVTRQEETVVTIKKQWHSAKKKIVRGLARKGFDFLNTGG